MQNTEHTIAVILPTTEIVPYMSAYIFQNIIIFEKLFERGSHNIHGVLKWTVNIFFNLDTIAPISIIVNQALLLWHVQRVTVNDLTVLFKIIFTHNLLAVLLLVVGVMMMSRRFHFLLYSFSYWYGEYRLLHTWNIIFWNIYLHRKRDRGCQTDRQRQWHRNRLTDSLADGQRQRDVKLEFTSINDMDFF